MLWLINVLYNYLFFIFNDAYIAEKLVWWQCHQWLFSFMLLMWKFFLPCVLSWFTSDVSSPCVSLLAHLLTSLNSDLQSASAECRPNPQFIQSPSGLRQTLVWVCLENYTQLLALWKKIPKASLEFVRNNIQPDNGTKIHNNTLHRHDQAVFPDDSL